MNLFVYGELCKPPVLLEVIGRVPVAEPAVLHGFVRELNAETGYFRVRELADSVVVGLLLRNIETQDFDALDRFENVAAGEYTRVETEVQPLSADAHLDAWVYSSV